MTGDVSDGNLNQICTSTIGCATSTTTGFAAVMLCSPYDFRSASFELSNGATDETLGCFNDIDYKVSSTSRYCSFCNADGKTSSTAASANSFAITGL